MKKCALHRRLLSLSSRKNKTTTTTTTTTTEGRHIRRIYIYEAQGIPINIYLKKEGPARRTRDDARARVRVRVRVRVLLPRRPVLPPPPPPRSESTERQTLAKGNAEMIPLHYTGTALIIVIRRDSILNGKSRISVIMYVSRGYICTIEYRMSRNRRRRRYRRRFVPISSVRACRLREDVLRGNVISGRDKLTAPRLFIATERI